MTTGEWGRRRGRWASGRASAHISFAGVHVRVVNTGDEVRYPALDGVISHVRQIQAVAALQQLLCFRG